MDHAGYTELTEELRGLMADRLSVRARTFPKAVRKAGRLLPEPARQAARELVEIEARLAHPKLAARTDPMQTQRAAETLRTSLLRHRSGALAGQRRSLLAAEIGFRALVILGAGLAFVQWQGLA
ncbi:hypothetical protein [Jannaschia sp. CCS1]|uniref:hypothetical protein n=1 Tax=Jannaschia sp. (strain CCS1) TaxID=290400 RepID=UPI00006C00CE|nr:hypothetical protein [Jannaschia sp. CCS1]ABD56354.1 hypothetical protein Jann_3437 [Jannaschia sp. CCS1]